MDTNCLNLKVGDLIYLEPHPVNSGDVYGIFVITEKDDYGFIIRATNYNRNILRPSWTRFPMYSRSYWGLEKCEVRRIA